MTRSIRNLVTLAGPAVATLLLAADAAASPDAHGEHHGISLFNWPSEQDPRIGLIWILINFVVLVLLLNKLIFRNLVASNVARHEGIKGELEQATRARAQAEAVLAEYSRKVDSLAAESQEILKGAREAAEADRRRILAEADAESAKIRAAALAAAEREVQSRRREIEAEIVDAAITRARELVLANFGDADQRRLVGDYVVAIEKAPIREGRAQ